MGFGDPIFGKPELIVASDVLSFAGVPPPKVRLYPIETHIAEKLHAYTQPRARPNSRVKDLPDLGLLATTKALKAKAVREALALTFEFRKSHDLPHALPPPSDAWRAPYAAMAREDGLPWVSLEDVTNAVRAFLDPVLSGEASGTWNPAAWKWSR